MKLNGIECVGYEQVGNTAKFLLKCDLADALTIEGELKVTDEKTDIAVFGGYQVTGVEKSGENTLAKFAMKLEPNIEETVNAILKQQNINASNITKVEMRTDQAQSTADNAQSSIASISEALEAYGEAIEELATATLS